MTKENQGKTDQKKIRIFGRIEEKTWQRWKKAAKKSGLTFTEWARRRLDDTPSSKAP